MRSSRWEASAFALACDMVLSMRRLTTLELIEVLSSARADGEGKEAHASTRGIVDTIIKATGIMQVFDFGDFDQLSGSVDTTLAAELWHRKLLRPPFPVTMMTFKTRGNRITLIVMDDIEVEDNAKGYGCRHGTAFALITQHGEEGDGHYAVADAFTWFEVPDGLHVKAGAVELSKCEGETDESFQQYTLTAAARLMTLCMLLNTKGVPRRYEPEPIKLNKKRALTGKPPLSAVTYIDLSRVSLGGTGHGGEKCMHLRRGHIRHYTDGSAVWVRDCVVKAEGEMKVRERYQIRK